MIKLLFKSYYSVFIFILISQPAFSAEGMNYKSFLGITLDEKFWVLIAFILFIILVSKKATNAANTALDNRSNVIKDKISSAEATLTEAKQLLNDSQQALTDHKNEVNNLINKQKVDVIFNALHGRFGEDGFIQTYLESKGLRYTHSGVLSSMMAMDKEISKKIFIKNKILTPKFLKIRTDLDKKKVIKLLKKKINFPVVIKPINEGSSLGVYICNEKNVIQNLNKLKVYDEILVEEFIPGREIQVAILGKKKLGAIELKRKRKFYYYEAKYS